jgi:hypothetical protein
MTRELLELAAKAAGIELRPVQINNVTEPGDDRFIGFMVDCSVWPRGWFNPLTDDGDAFRLAVKLGLAINITPSRIYASDGRIDGIYETMDKADPYSATRRAIVRAAAEIGRAMK